ncbi:MAG: hypothetical protein R3F61_01500 [Myxococcota bacterium]
MVYGSILAVGVLGVALVLVGVAGVGWVCFTNRRRSRDREVVESSPPTPVMLARSGRPPRHIPRRERVRREVSAPDPASAVGYAELPWWGDSEVPDDQDSRIVAAGGEPGKSLLDRDSMQVGPEALFAVVGPSERPGDAEVRVEPAPDPVGSEEVEAPGAQIEPLERSVEPVGSDPQPPATLDRHEAYQTGALASLVRQQALDERVGDRTWVVDPDRGVLVFGSGDARTAFSASMLGTVDLEDEGLFEWLVATSTAAGMPYFLAGHADESTAIALLVDATERVQSRGLLQAIAELSTLDPEVRDHRGCVRASLDALDVDWEPEPGGLIAHTPTGDVHVRFDSAGRIESARGTLTNREELSARSGVA